MGKDIKTGQVEAVEVNTGQIPGQMSIADTPGVQLSESDTEEVAEINGKTVDTTTGEIIMEQENKVIDLRAKQA